jgi:hypothetical protein
MGGECEFRNVYKSFGQETRMKFQSVQNGSQGDKMGGYGLL